jgi:UDP-N-acetylglucosamine--N-acetylmuramyl-(pentapeptide) pyrophosphoryl-undecaprenol N-acetylglucosamine transferase
VFRTRTHVGIYVDDAPGPIARAGAIVPHLRSQVTLLSRAELPDLPVTDDVLHLRLPEPGGQRPTATRAPETVPRSLGPAGAAELVAWMEQESPDLLFVDGPPDVALFARLAGVPVVVLRRHGRRTPAQRQLLDRTVLGALAPYTEDLGPGDDPTPTRTVHTGLLSRFAGRPRDRARARHDLGIEANARLVTVLCGKEGPGVSTSELLATAEATPGWSWQLVGEEASGAPHEAVRPLGWVADPWPHLVAADVVIAGASLSAVAEAADAEVPLIVVSRPSAASEERRFADALGAVGAALPLAAWLAPGRWAATLDAAVGMDTRPLASRRDARAARRAAEWLDVWAAMPATGPSHEPSVTEELGLLLEDALPVAGPGGHPA